MGQWHWIWRETSRRWQTSFYIIEPHKNHIYGVFYVCFINIPKYIILSKVKKNPMMLIVCLTDLPYIQTWPWRGRELASGPAGSV